jgi:hypothetical protein
MNVCLIVRMRTSSDDFGQDPEEFLSFVSFDLETSATNTRLFDGKYFGDLVLPNYCPV